MTRKDPEHIGVILKQLFCDQEWETHLQVSRLLLRWQELVGPQIAKQSQPEYLKDEVLQVRVENSVWLNHLRFLEEELRRRLNKKLSSLTVKEIRFRQGPLEILEPQPVEKAEDDIHSPQNAVQTLPPLSPEQCRLLEAISDDELRRDLEALLRSQQAHSRT